MINLMPDDDKKEIRAARINVVLTRYIFVIIVAFAFLMLLLAGSYVVLTQTSNSAKQIIDANKTKADAYSQTKTQVDALSSSLSQTKIILDQEVLYSKALVNIGQQMVPGTVLENITLNAASFTGTPVNIKAYAKTTDDVVKLREKFQAAPFFSSVNFDTVSTTAGIDGYPMSVTITLTVLPAAAK